MTSERSSLRIGERPARGQPLQPLLRVADVTAVFGISRATLYRRIADGTVPAVRIGGILRFRREAIEALITVAEAGTPKLVGED